MKKETSRDLNYQIKFFEQLLERNPDYADAMIALAEVYTKKGLYQKGFEIDLRLSQIKKNDPIVYYNLACSLSLLGRIEQALSALSKAICLGYNDFDYINQDSDLNNLREDKRFRELLKTAVKNEK
ncbi:MAG: tetratricopeptide repeat protein [Candidatus Gygaella obscura]|nr:tetratricopeptide repeat protein [Candidatus Gygaella obscura]